MFVPQKLNELSISAYPNSTQQKASFCGASCCPPELCRNGLSGYPTPGRVYEPLPPATLDCVITRCFRAHREQMKKYFCILINEEDFGPTLGSSRFYTILHPYFIFFSSGSHFYTPGPSDSYIIPIYLYCEINCRITSSS